MSIAIANVDDTKQATINTWLLWIAVSAAVPVMSVLRDVLMQRRFGLYFQGQNSIIVIALIALTLAPALIQWSVLRRLAPQMSLFLWLAASWVSAIFAYYILDGMRMSGFYSERAFELAMLRRQPGGSSWWPWLQLALQAAFVSLCYNVAPLLAFGWMTKRRMRAFLLATVLGTCTAVLLFKLYSQFNFLDSRSFYDPLGMMRAQSPWGHILQIAAVVALFGMVQGAIAGYGLMRMFASPVEPLGADVVRVFGLVAIVLVAAHGVRYATSPLGYAAGFPDIRRIFSTAPATDRSGGAPILSFAHKIALPGPAWYVAPSADGRTALVVMKDKSLRRIDGERRIVAEAPVITDESARSVVFSPDGRYAAISQQGQRRGKNDFHFGRVRLFATDGFAEIKDFQAAEQDCAFSSTMTFSADSGRLWVACERSRANPRDLLAVALSIPELEIIERRPVPDAVAGKGSPALADIMATNGGVYFAFYDGPNPPRQIVIVGVSNAGPIFVSRDTAEMGGDGFGFAGLHLSSDAKLVTLAHGALPDRLLKRDVYQSTGQFRTFDTSTGNLVADFGRQSGVGDVTQWSVAFDRGRGRFAGIGTTLASKEGTLAIWNQGTGRELQHIATPAYRTGKFSLDGRWLMLLGRDEDALYLYRAAP